MARGMKLPKGIKPKMGRGKKPSKGMFGPAGGPPGGIAPGFSGGKGTKKPKGM